MVYKLGVHKRWHVPDEHMPFYVAMLRGSGKKSVLQRYAEAKRILLNPKLKPFKNQDSLFKIKLIGDSTHLLGARQLYEVMISSGVTHAQPAGLQNLAVALKANVTLLSGCSINGPYRYRIMHQAQSLMAAGYVVTVIDDDVLNYDFLRDFQGVLLCHRCQLDGCLRKVIVSVRQNGGAVVFDTDDLVFDPDLIGAMDTQWHVSRRALRNLTNQIHRQRAALEISDAVTVSTEALAEHVRRLFPEKPVMVSRNMVSAEMLRLYDEAAKARPQRPSDVVTAAYFSGTQTHQRDFAECANAVSQLLQKYPHFHLLVVGLLDVAELKKRYPAQVATLPLTVWQKLPELYRQIDINLAPLEMNNEFTRCKSDLKYYEAAFAGKPTVASNWGEFAYRMKHGKTGLLCSTSEEWYAALELLIVNPQLRETLGVAAHADVQRTTSLSANPVYHAAVLEELLVKIGKRYLLQLH